MFNAFLVCGLAGTVLRSRALGLAAALIYAAAPGHAIAVYWNALYSMTGTVSWYLACLWVWMSPRGRVSGLRFFATFLLFLGAMLSSEHAVTLPVPLLLGAVFVRGEEFWPALRRLAPFFAVAAAYSVLKIMYLRFGLAMHFPDVMAQGFVLRNYQPAIDPLASLRLLGFYVGCTFGWLYRSSPEAWQWYGVGTVMLALFPLSYAWARFSSSGREVLFGLVLFVSALGPVLLLPNHPFGYYVGTAAAGLAIAVVAAVRALPRWNHAAVAGVVAVIIAGELLVGDARFRQSPDMAFFAKFQSGALSWLDAVEQAAHANPSASEIVVPRNPVTELVFDAGRGDVLLLRDVPPVRLSADIEAEATAPGRVVVRGAGRWQRGLDYPGRQERWDWLRGGVS